MSVVSTTPYRGSIDVISGDQIKGWAFDDRTPERHVDVRLIIDGQSIPTVAANEFRADLAEAEIGNGDHAFSINIPIRFFDGRTHDFQIFDARTGGPITPVVPFHCPDANRSAFEGAVDGISEGVLYGWVYNWTNPNIRCRVTLKAGPMELGSFMAQRPRPDLVEGGIGDGRYGFAVRLPRQLPHELMPITVHVSGTDFELRGSPLHLNFADTITELEPDIRRRTDAASLMSALRHRLERSVRLPMMQQSLTGLGTAELASIVEQLRMEMKVLLVMGGPHLGASDLPPIGWPDLSSPAFSLVLLDQRRIDATFQLLANLAPSVVGNRAEVLIHVQAGGGMAAHYRRVFPNAKILESGDTDGPLDILAAVGAQASGTSLLFLDGETTTDASSLDELSEILTARGHSVGLAGGVLLSTDGTVAAAGARMMGNGSIEVIGRGSAPGSTGIAHVHPVDYHAGGFVGIHRALLLEVLGRAPGMASFDYQWFVIARLLQAEGRQNILTPFATATRLPNVMTEKAVEALELDRKTITRNYGRLFGAIGTAIRSLATLRNEKPKVLFVQDAVQDWGRGLAYQQLLRRADLFARLGCPVSVLQLGQRFNADTAQRLNRQGIQVLGDGDLGLDRIVTQNLSDGDIVYFDKPLKHLEDASDLRLIVPGLRILGGFGFEDKALLDELGNYRRHRTYEQFDRLLVEQFHRPATIDINDQIVPLMVPARIGGKAPQFDQTAGIALIEPTPASPLREAAITALVDIVSNLSAALPGVVIDSYFTGDTSLLPIGTPGIRARHSLADLCMRGANGYRLLALVDEAPGPAAAVLAASLEAALPLVAAGTILREAGLVGYPVQAQIKDKSDPAQVVATMYSDSALWAQARLSIDDIRDQSAENETLEALADLLRL